MNYVCKEDWHICNNLKGIPVHGVMLNWAGLKSMLDRVMGSSMVAVMCSSMVLIVSSVVPCPVITMVGTVVMTSRTIGKHERGKG